jgi:DNA modification methylase
MSANTPPKTTKVTPAVGLTAHLKNKSRSRREAQQLLASIGVHAPTRRNDLLPQLNIVYAAIDQIQPAVRRVRRKDAAQTARVLSSIRKFGIVAPILVDQDFRIVHGHAVYEAAREAGLTRIPVIRIDHLEPSELRLLSIALNRLAETGSWNEDVLRVEVEELLDLGEDIFVAGFETAEVDNLLLIDDDAPAEDEAGLEDLLSADSVSKPGDIWQLGRHRLLQGDARDPASYARLMAPGELARIVLTDTPYNVPNAGHVTTQARHREFAMARGELSREEFADFIRAWMAASAAHLVDGGLLATFIDWRSIDLVLASGRELGLQLLNIIVWAKSNGGQGSFWRSQHELLPVFKKGTGKHVNNVELGRFGRWRSNLWTYAGASTLGSDARDGLTVHPTVKPRLLLEDALLDVSQRDEIVLEPFAGSGSTLLAAETVGRMCRAIEIDGPYCDVVIKRWQAMAGEDAILERSGETYSQVAQRGDNEGEA